MCITRKRYKNKKFFASLWGMLFFLSGIWILLIPQKVLSQNIESSKLKVSINNISLNRDLEVHGLIADFPFPILTIITVLDSTGMPVPGLANTSRWLRQDEITEIGLPVSDIWQPLLEYHDENHDLPLESDIKVQQPQPLITEIREETSIPIRTMLVMDASWSMRNEIVNAIEGARIFVRMMRSNDDVGIVIFDDQILTLQPITADTNQLMSVLNAAKARGRTGLYDALLVAINQLKDASGKRAIIVYADGEDNASKHTVKDVIDSALYHNTSIFTIAYGTGANPDTLEYLSDSTGGLFFQTDSSQNIEEIYMRLSRLIHNFYVMAHTSTDPARNNTWRIVDLTVNTPSGLGGGTGKYFVEGAVEFSDVSIALSAVTDTFLVQNNDTLQATRPGKNIQYQIRVRNLESEIANDLKIVHILPEQVEFVSASETPGQFHSQTLNWEFSELAPGSEMAIQINVFLPDSDFPHLMQLRSQAHVYTANDSSLQNNSAIDSITVLNPPKPPVEPKFDLALTQVVNTDSTIFVNGDSIKVILPGQQFGYRLQIQNMGPVIAHQIKLWDISPDSVNIFDFTRPFSSQSGDTLFWLIDSLEVGQQMVVDFKARLADSVLSDSFQVINRSGLFARLDSLPENNFAETTILAIPYSPDVDVSVLQFVETDSFAVISGDTVHYAKAGETYQYFIRIQNPSKGVARNIFITDSIPEFVSVGNFNYQPVQNVNRIVTWEINQLLPDSTFLLTFDAAVPVTMPIGENFLINKIMIQAENESAAFLGNNSVVDTVINIEPEPVPPVDIAVIQATKTDSFAVIAGDTIRYAKSGETYHYLLRIQNPSKRVAQNIVVTDSLPEFVTVSNFNRPPVQNANRKIIWEISQLLPDSMLQITFDATVPVTMPVGENLLINQVQIQAQNEDNANLNNNSAVDTVVNLQSPPRPAVDIAVLQFVKTDSFTIIAGDTIRYAESGEKYRYHLRIQNPSEWTAQNIVVTDSIPAFVTVANFNFPPVQNGNRKVIWEINQLLAKSDIQIEFDATVPVSMPVGKNLLINQVKIQAQNEDITNLNNNSVVDTVFNIQSQQPSPVDVSVTQFTKTDSFNVADGDTVHYAKSNETYQYQILIQNLSQGVARNIIVTDSLPAFVTTNSYNFPPSQNANRKLIWEINQLLPDSAFLIRFTATLPALMPLGQNFLINQVRIQAQNEDQEYLGNNSVTDTVFNIQGQPPRPVDIAVTQFTKTDSFVVIAGDTAHYAKSGETYQYHILVQNPSEGVARNMVVTDSIPEFVTVGNFNRQPVQNAKRKLIWEISQLLPDSIFSIRFDAMVPIGMPLGENLLINRIQISAQNETEEYRNNNAVIDTVYNIQSEPPVDISITQLTKTDSFTVSSGDTIRYAKSGETYQYRILIQNPSEGVARNIVVTDSIPDYIVTSNFSRQTTQNANRIVTWEISELMPDSMLLIRFDATLPVVMPVGENLLVNRVRIQAQNESSLYLNNNNAADTVYNIQAQLPVEDLVVTIGTLPSKVEVGEPISIEIQVSNPVQSWDLWVYLANSEIEKNFADELTSTLRIEPGIKFTLPVKYTNTRLYSTAENEEIIFELIITDIFGNTSRASTSVQIHSNNDFVLDRNVYQPESEESLGINFKLSTNRQATLDVYDLAGSHIIQLSDAFYLAGWNTYYWNGWTQNGMKVGSGLYLITLKSDQYNAYKKVMIVR